MSRPSAVVVGGIGKLPYAGVSLYYLHYLVGLRELGYRVHYVERQEGPFQAYDPDADAMTDRPDFALRYLSAIAGRFGFAESWSFVDRAGACHGAAWKDLRDVLDRADFVLTVADPTWFDDLGRCRRRVFVDGDPMFTQVALAKRSGSRAEAPPHYDTLFTYASRIGREGCLVPNAGREWLPTRPVVATACWDQPPPPARGPFVALMHWAAGAEVDHEGRSFGHKGREFQRFLELPRRRPGDYVLAAGGPGVPREVLAARGWRLVGPLSVTGSVDAYRRFIAGARADLGIAKHAYVASRSGWFSDRSTCFLASGRPVLHQDTGYTDWLATDEGVLPFSDLDSLVEAVDRLDRDYVRHARAARRIAERHFEASVVIAEMLEAAGLR
ncbi:MAG TPA: hypothetical protein VGB87_23175 [Vicinamibacteria bacterium]